MYRVAIVLLAVAACGGGSKPATTVANTQPPPPPPPADTCSAAVEHSMSLLSAKDAAPPDMVKQISTVMATRCEADKWSAELRHCMVAGKDLAELDQCEHFFTPEQKAALQKAADESFGAKGGASAGEPPPPPPEDQPDEDEAAARPAAPPAKATRGPKQKPKSSKTGDPDEGGQ